ncbi:MAG: MBL fold metallo-hydrolase [Chloroflexi bacterium]|nr:MBL fold metallo-hydrolase [Chloroflexota bacterium]MDA1228338.1 MBL fold metallo-hydrolase [Chloroflexota bacterium]
MTTAPYKSGVIEVADNAYAIIKENCATNSGFIVGEEGVILIDTLMTPTLAGNLLTTVRNVTSKPIRYVINTHFHGDHVYGNQYFLPAPIVAHENCRTAFVDDWDGNMNRYYAREALRPELDQIRMTRPDVTFNDEMSLWLGDREIRLSFHGRAHTGSDILIYLPEEKVLFVGDLAVNKTLPAFPDGHITKWLSVMDDVSKVDAETIVPGHGPVGGRTEYNESVELLGLLNSEIRRGYDAGLSEEDAAKQVDISKFADFANHDRVGLITRMAYRAYSGDLQ